MMAGRPPSRSFLALLCVSCLSVIALVAVINGLVDPYAILQGDQSLLPRECKVKTFDTQRMTKASDVMRLKPHAILLGSSRVVDGCDAAAIGQLLGIDCYNLGIAGASFQEAYHFFEHALYHQPDLKVVIVGIDLFGFNQARDSAHPDPKLSCSRWPIKEYASLVASWDALMASIETMKYAWRHFMREKPYYRQFVDAKGNIAEALIDAHIQKRRPTFAQREQSILNELMTLPVNYGSFRLSQTALDLFSKMVKTCQERHITLKVFFSPCRAIYWQGVWVTGCWDQLEQLKRELVKQIDVWDFSGVNEVTAEPFLDAPDSHYFESSHYRPHVGMRIARLLFGHEAQPFGTHLTNDHLDEHLLTLRNAQISWAEHHQDAIEFLRSCL